MKNQKQCPIQARTTHHRREARLSRRCSLGWSHTPSRWVYTCLARSGTRPQGTCAFLQHTDAYMCRMPVHLLPGETYKKKICVFHLPQKRGFSSLLSPQWLNPSHRFSGKMQMLVVSHLTWPLGQILSAATEKDPNTHHRMKTVEPAVAFFTRGEVFTTVLIL